MNEDETWEALRELHRDGKIDHAPGIGAGTDHGGDADVGALQQARDVLLDDE
jgi:hypothetical protein